MCTVSVRKLATRVSGEAREKVTPGEASINAAQSKFLDGSPIDITNCTISASSDVFRSSM